MLHHYYFQNPGSNPAIEVAKQGFKRIKPCLIVRLYAPVLLLIVILFCGPQGTKAQSCSIPVNYANRSIVKVGIADYGKVLGVAIADFNSDGKPDMATLFNGSPLDTPTDGVFSVVLGDGEGNFGSPVAYPVWNANTFPKLTSIIAGDWNLDGKADVAITNGAVVDHAGAVLLFYGNGSGGMDQGDPSFSNGDINSNPLGFITDDFNRDGYPDFATVAPQGFSLSVALALKGYYNWNTNDQNDGSNGIASGDFNGDGKVDLMTTRYDAGNVSLRLGDGNGGFTKTKDITVGSNPISITSGDFNLDGILDVAVRRRFAWFTGITAILYFQHVGLQV